MCFAQNPFKTDGFGQKSHAYHFSLLINYGSGNKKAVFLPKHSGFASVLGKHH